MSASTETAMSDFVTSKIGELIAEHEKMITGWKGFDDIKISENVSQLYDLFKNCGAHEIRLFEEVNFCDRRHILHLITGELTRRTENEKEGEEKFEDNEHEDRQETCEKADESLKKARKKKKKKKIEMNNSQKITESCTQEPFQIMPPSQKEKPRNPFDNENAIVMPSTQYKAKEEPADFVDSLQVNYLSTESMNLKTDLQKLAKDISIEEKCMREKMESGEKVNLEHSVLEDFISRANHVLKETEAVTVRKIAEAETRKFLSSNSVKISSELMQEIWPKTNKWRGLTRNNNFQKPDQNSVDRDVRAAIKSAGESLTKKQIGQIRNAAIVYRDFDQNEEKEIEYRNDQILKLITHVSDYEYRNQLDELNLLRLATAFCSKRRDHFLKNRLPNFMQFSYMYIYLLEKLNNNTALICACLNYQKTLGCEFDELEELLLNLFHEDYFLNNNNL